MSDIDRATKKGFLYLQGHMKRVLLVPQPIHPGMWMSLYILAYGANAICERLGGNIALSFIPSDDEHFCVEVQGDSEALVDEVHEMVDAFGNSPDDKADEILEGIYPGMARAATPDHDEILEGLYEIVGGDTDPKIVAVFEHGASAGAATGPSREITPEMEYWVDYWGMRDKRQRAI